MMATPDAIPDLVTRLDFNRGGTTLTAHGAGFKEWLHFCVYAPGVDLLANFSSVHRVHGTAGADRRAVVLARAERWTGSVELDPDARMPSGKLGARVGRSSVRFDGERYELVVRPDACDVEAELTLRPVTFPSPTHNVEVENGPPLHWMVIPRLEASGFIRVGEQRTEFARAAAYHDHNWGAFRWGHDFAWEWGYCLPANPDVPFSIVAVRLTNRRRTRTLAQALFLWDGARQSRIFRGDAITVVHEGLLRPERVFKLPKVMTLARGGTATDIPKRFEMRARREGDELQLAFEPNDVAQVVIPNDDDLGFTTINEVQGSFFAQGRVRGKEVLYDGTGVFEFLGN